MRLTKKDCHYYEAQVGGKEFSWFGGDDKQAIKKIAKWVRLYWVSYVKSIQQWSIAYTQATEIPTVIIVRRFCAAPAYVVPYVRPAIVYSGELEPFMVQHGRDQRERRFPEN